MMRPIVITPIGTRPISVQMLATDAAPIQLAAGPRGPAGGAGSALNLGPPIIPDGLKDGVNPNFTLPFDAPFLLLTLRGRVLMQDFDFTRNGVNLQMVAGNEPFADDPFLAFLIGDQP